MQSLKLTLIGSLSLLLMASAFAGESKGRVIMAGGDCEDSPSSNLFFDSMSTAALRFAAGGWEIEAQYDNFLARCSLPESDPKCSRSSKEYSKEYWNCCPRGYSEQNWGVKSFSKRIGQTEAQVTKNTTTALIEKLNRASSEMTSGQQLMLVLETHGSPEKKIKYRVKRSWRDKQGKLHVRRKWVEKTVAHGVCMADGFLQMDDPRLKDALKKLKAKGIKIGISDNSCYSGGSVKPLSKYGCVISSSTPAVVTWGSSALEQLARASESTSQSKSGKSLSEFYRDLLQTDRRSRTNAPMLSGFDAQEDWMQTYSELANQTQGVKSVNCPTCRSNDNKEVSFANFKNLQKLIDLLKKKGRYDGPLAQMIDEYEKKLKELYEKAHFEERIAQQEQDLLSVLYSENLDVDYRLNGALGKEVTQEIFDQAVQSLEKQGVLFKVGGRLATKDGVGTFEDPNSLQYSNREIWIAQKIGDEIKKNNPAIWTDISQSVAMTKFVTGVERKAFEKLPADRQARLKKASDGYNMLLDQIQNVNPHIFEIELEDEMSALLNRFRASIYDQYVSQLQGDAKEQYKACQEFML